MARRIEVDDCEEGLCIENDSNTCTICGGYIHDASSNENISEQVENVQDNDYVAEEVF